MGNSKGMIAALLLMFAAVGGQALQQPPPRDVAPSQRQEPGVVRGRVIDEITNDREKWIPWKTVVWPFRPLPEELRQFAAATGQSQSQEALGDIISLAVGEYYVLAQQERTEVDATRQGIR